MAEVLKKFGRYFLLDMIAQGGMAEIYRARLAAADGAGRLIVIKRIQPTYGANKEFLQMFKSEIKTTMGFSHPNIAQLYDFGEEKEQPYIAMELVDGKNLRQFAARALEAKQTFPIDLAVYIIEQAACGLHYAHSFKEKISGEPLNIVHRDISPQNILISYEGNVKVIDFGIAKATTNVESTRAGIIKGKPSYLSPEQISGDPLDGRCDIFALGTVLWELLAGRKLFAGENDLAVLKLIESCQTYVKAPSTVNPNVPKELDYIVLKALTKQRENRYQTADELQRALHKFLYSYSPDFNPQDLAQYAKELYKDEIVEDRKRIQRLNDKVEQLLALDIPEAPISGETSVSAVEPKEDTTTVVDRQRSTGARDAFTVKDRSGPIELEKQGPGRPQGSRGPQPSPQAQQAQSAAIRRNARPEPPKQQAGVGRKDKPKHPARYAVGAVAALLLAALFGPDFGFKVPVLSDVFADLQGGDSARLVLQGNQKDVSVSVNGQVVASSLPATLKDLPVGTQFHLVVSGPTTSFQGDFTLKKGEKKIVAIGGNDRIPGSVPANGPAAPEAGKSVSLRLNLMPSGDGAAITVMGRNLDAANPVTVVPLDTPLDLTVDKPGYRPLHRAFVLDSHQIGALTEWPMDVALEPVNFGFLTIHTTPSADATIMIDGKPWVRKTPLENEKLPIGTYNVHLSNDVLGMVKDITVNIQEGKVVTREERLEIRN